MPAIRICASIAAALACGAAVVIVAMLAVPRNAGAQDGGARVSPPTIALEPATATVGDRITLTITITRRSDVTIAAPTFGADFGGLDLTDVAPPAEQQRGGSIEATYRYTLVAFKTGRFTVPPLMLTYTDASGASGGVPTEPRSVAIVSVLAPGETSLNPLKPQLDLSGGGAPPPFTPALFVGAFAALTAFGYALHRRIAAMPPPQEARPEAPVPPHVAARAALDALEPDSGVAAPDAYYAAIAATLRRYLSDRFGFPAYAMTRTELQRGMTAAGIDRWPARLTANLLTQCDAVQFAAFRPPRERCDADLTAAYEIIALTTEPPTATTAVLPEAPTLTS